MERSGNFLSLIHIYAEPQRIAGSAGLPFDVLKPLIAQTAAKGSIILMTLIFGT